MDNLTMRQRWYSLPSLFGLGAITFFVVLGFFTHTAFWLAVGIAVVWVWYKLSLRIEVTSTDVVVGQWPFPKSSASREAIKVMHWFGRSVTFVDDDHRVLLKIGAMRWAGGQLLDLSEALGVRLYTHRTRRGLGTDAQTGQLVQHAAKAD